jgi:hypothetical protein
LANAARAAQKCALDLPALLLDPVFENRLVFWLCNTHVTPNQVTLFTALLGACITALFFYDGCVWAFYSPMPWKSSMELTASWHVQNC